MDFNSNPTETEVTFCHASIGDFFRNESEGKVSVGSGYSDIGVNLIEAKFHVLKTCLELFCRDELRMRSDGKRGASIYIHAKQCWLDYFRQLDPSLLNDQMRKQIRNLLTKMLGDKAVMGNWAESGSGIFQPENYKRLCKWLSDPESRLSYEAQGSASSTSELPPAILKPLARFVAEQWLCNEDWPEIFCYSQIYTYLCLEGRNCSYRFSNERAVRIIAVAEWANLEKNALWYSRVAMALHAEDKYDKAIEFFNKALELDGTMIMARGGMSKCYFKKGEYKKAIELYKVTEKEYQQALIDKPAELQSINYLLHETQEWILECYNELDDKGNVFRYYGIAHATNPYCGYCTDGLISGMHERGLYDDIITTLKALKKSKPPGKKYSYLTEALWGNRYPHDRFNLALQGAIDHTSELNFVLEAYHDASRAARNESLIVTASLLDLCLAQLYYRDSYSQKKAVQIWERVFSMFVRPEQAADQGPGFAKNHAAFQLARHSLRQAVDAGIGSPDGGKHIERLENLPKWKVQVVGDSSAFFSTGASATILGLWYRLVGKKEDAEACFRASIKKVIEMCSNSRYGDLNIDPELVDLCDDGGDLYNEAAGLTNFLCFAQLGEVFLAAGEFDSTIAICQILGKLLHDDEGVFRCDGCSKWRIAYNIYFCKYCIGIGFCEDCMKLVKDGTMRLGICSSQHDWMFVPPPPQGIEKNMLFIDGAMVTLDDFKKDLRRRWQL